MTLQLAAILALSLPAPTAPVADLLVPSQFPTIQSAIAAATPSDRVVVAPGTYTESIDFLGKSIPVLSSGGHGVTTIDGAGLGSSLVLAASGESLGATLEGFTLVNGEGSPQLTCVSFGRAGGAIFIDTGSALTVRDCVFLQNGVNGLVVMGGAIAVFRGSLRAVDCTFLGNGVPDEDFGGAIGACADDPVQTIELEGCRFDGNGSAFGGGVWVSRYADTRIVECEFTTNRASHGGGLWWTMPSEYGSNLTVERSWFRLNESSFGAGANITADRNTVGAPGTVLVRDCSFEDNLAGFGAGMLLNGGVDSGLPGPDPEIVVTGSEFVGNRAEQCCNVGGYFTPCYVDGLGQGPSGTWVGGALDMRVQYGGRIEVVNCVASGNSATIGGAYAISSCGGGEVSVVNNTIVDNVPTGIHVRQGVEMLQLQASVLVANTILTGNGTTAADQLVDESAADPQIAFEARYDLVDGGFPGTGNVAGPAGFIASDVGAYCPAPGSAAIDAGDNAIVPAGILTDAQGLPRFVDDPATPDTGLGTAPLVDIGAFEAQAGGCTIGVSYCNPVVPNSTGSTSALAIYGSPIATRNQVRLTVDALPRFSFAFFLASEMQGFVANPGGSQGNLCLGGSIGRYVGPGEIQNSGNAGHVALTLDLPTTPQPTGFVAVQAGETWNFQLWHRDAVGGSATSNFSDGVSLTFQ